MDGSVIAEIGELLALCGIASVRSFLPTFIVLFVARLAQGAENCPQALLDVVAGVPEVMIGNGVLTLFGILAVVELVANWDETVRQILEDSNFDLYFKPFYAFVFAIVAGAPAETVGQLGAAASAVSGMSQPAVSVVTPPTPEEGLPWLAWVWNVFSSGAAGFGTWAFCTFRAKIAAALRSIDPDNTFHLHTLAKLAEETIWMSLLLVAIVVPVLAAILVVALMAIGAFFRKILAVLTQQCSHTCASCGAMVHNSAVVCPDCGKVQPMPYRRVGLFTLASSASVDPGNVADVTCHHRRFLSAHRCPLCASPLRDGFVCDKCGARIWEQGITRRDLVGRLDSCVIVATITGIVLCAVPVLGFLVSVAWMNLLAIRILRSYESRLGRFIVRLVFRIVKWTMIIFAVVFSAVPFAGIAFIVPYLVYYLWLRRRFLAEQVSHE